MIYIPNSYPASKIMRSKDPSTLRMISLWKFKSTKSHKWYIVEIEEFSNHLWVKILLLRSGKQQKSLFAAYK